MQPSTLDAAARDDAVSYAADTSTRLRAGTIAYYNKEAANYTHRTLQSSMSDALRRFVCFVAPGGLVLDAGSGSGRDTAALVDLGYRVEAIDASAEMAAISTQITGIPTRHMRIEDIEDVDRFDGLWACAVLLHIPERDQVKALQRLRRCLRGRG
jgi:SAM-dependent methyltransferase